MGLQVWLITSKQTEPDLKLELHPNIIRIAYYSFLWQTSHFREEKKAKDIKI